MWPSRRETELLGILLNGEMYGRAIKVEYERKVRKGLPLGSLYVTLDRMEAKRLITSYFGESSHERGGNRRKYYRLTALGRRAADAMQDLPGAIFGVP